MICAIKFNKYMIYYMQWRAERLLSKGCSNKNLLTGYQISENYRQLASTSGTYDALPIINYRRASIYRQAIELNASFSAKMGGGVEAPIPTTYMI